MTAIVMADKYLPDWDDEQWETWRSAINDLAAARFG
jgi:hypothetical protein